ncbi:MAG: TolC family protein [Saprospiraceae bacterium]|nr:TolC family protein [Saprospiraceae bacterium]
MMKKLFYLVGFISCFGEVNGQELEKFTLNEAVAYAQTKSNVVRTAQLDVARAKAEVQEYTSIGIPKLSAGVEYNYFIHLPTQLIPNDAFVFELPPPFPPMPDPEPGYSETQFGTRNNLNFTFNFNTLILDGSYFVGLKASKGLVEMTRRQAELNIYEIKHVVIKAYLTVLVAEENVMILSKNIENLDKMKKETKAFLENGLVEQLDLERIELSVANLMTELNMLNRQLELAYNVLKFQMNYPLNQTIELLDDLESLLYISQESDLTGDIGIDKRIDRDILKQTIYLNELNTKRYNLGYLPTLQAFAVHQQGLQRDDLFDANSPGFFPTTILGLQLNVPIFDGLDKAAKIKKSKIDVQKFKIQLNDLERGIELEISNARANFKNAQQRLKNQNLNLSLAEKIYNTTQIKYREGVGSSMEMTQSEQELYRTQANRLNALYELVISKADLDKALGN